jgi:hypothetical protein
MPEVVGDDEACFEHCNLPWLTEEAQTMIDRALAFRKKK